MNIKQIFLPLFGALALIGCNNEALEPTSSNETETQPVRLALTMEATADASEMRAIIFDTSKGIPPTAGNTEAKWTTHCFLHKSGDASKRAYAVIEWDVTNATAGQIKLKMRGSELSLQQSGSQPLVIPQPGERWIITGITGGGKLNADKTRVEFSADGAYDALEANQAQVPFTFEPQGFDVASEGMRAPQISVHFKPQGSLLNVHVNNATNRGKHAVATDLKLYTNALSNNGYYDYSTGEAQWKFTNAAAQEEVISRPISLDKDAAAKYVLWGMPRPETAKPSEGFKSEIYLGRYKIFAEGSTTAKPKVRDEAFTNGLAYPMGINIDRPFMPLEYVAKRNIAPRESWAGGNPTFATSDLNNASGYFSWTEAIATDLSTAIIEGVKYHLPSIQELEGMFPARVDGARHFSGANYPNTNANNYDETVMVEGGLLSGKADYYSSGNYILYAVRFKNESNDNMNTTVYRYSFTTQALNSQTAHLEVISRWVGNTLGNIDQLLQKIQEGDFWTTNTQDDVKVIFPATGYYKGAKGVKPLELPGETGRYWSSTKSTNPTYPTMAEHANFYKTNVNGHNLNDPAWSYSVRLFKDRVK